MITISSVEGTTADASVGETTLGGVLPCLTIGSGPPLVVLTGLSAEHRNPTGLDRSTQVRMVRRLAPGHTVHLVGRRPGLPTGTRMRDLASDVTDELHRVTAPTLVGGGTRDGFYTPALFERTARGILGARLALYPRKGHVAVTSHRLAQREIAAFLTG